METNELIQKLRETLPEPIDYAEAVGAPEWAYRHIYIYDDPLYYHVEEAIEKLKEFQNKLDEAEKDIQSVLWGNNDPCNLCKHHHICEYMDCDKYIEGIGMTDEDGKYYDWKWSCLDFDYGTCDKLENTPCNGCDLINHFEWKGR